MAAIRDQAGQQDIWRRRLAERLPSELLAYVTGVVAREGELVVFTVSAAWGVRLRYAIAEVEPQLLAAGGDVTRVVVRVLPGKAPKA